MRMIWQAIRAVTVEVMGVGAVIFMLFGAAGWTVESAGVQPKQEVDRAWKWLQETTEQVAASIKPNLTDDQRQQFAAERLDYYGHLYGEATSGYASRAAGQMDFQLIPADQRPSLPTNQLLGTL
ncbi:MAG TPA: hypothetical protein VMM76_22020 [Pirellulaceae bacterium]|nr:hypothetical protein [Pirellulaceae bacterium]